MGRTLIGPRTTIPGPLESEDDLEILGTVLGAVHGRGQVVVGSTATIHGAVRGHHVTLEGRLDHPIFAVGTVRLTKSAQLRADITAARIAIDEGAVFEGQVKMVQATPVASAPQTAPAAQTARAVPAAQTAQAVPAPGVAPERAPRAGARAIPEPFVPNRQAAVRRNK